MYKDAEGAVITGPRNFYTTKMKKGRVGRGTFFSGVIPHKEEDPEAEKKLRLTEMAYHKSKLPEDGSQFKSMGGHLFMGTFSRPKEVYGGPSLAVTKEFKFRPNSVKIAQVHDGAMFKPAGPRKQITLGKFPEFMPNPPKELKAKKKNDADPDEPPAFRPSTREFSRPTPSIVTNARNLRSHISIGIR